MNKEEVLTLLESLGSEQTRRIWASHGAKPPLFGVKIGDMKIILKKTKKNHALALELYATRNADAMYLAGLMADPKQFDVATLQAWVAEASWSMLSEYTVAWMAAESHFAELLADKWIDADSEHIASSGWATWASYVSLKPDTELNLSKIETLLDRIVQNIPVAPNRVRLMMNGFVIAVGTYVLPLREKAKETADQIGVVKVDMNGTACKVPAARAYIEKAEQMNAIPRKRKTVVC
jgi:3-methyladenine DNA glycosylase AlkD